MLFITSVFCKLKYGTNIVCIDACLSSCVCVCVCVCVLVCVLLVLNFFGVSRWCLKCLKIQIQRKYWTQRRLELMNPDTLRRCPYQLSYQRFQGLCMCMQVCLHVSFCLYLNPSLNIVLITHFLQGTLQPSDDITVYYQTSGNLARIIPEYKEFIFNTIKQPLLPYPVPSHTELIVQEKMKVIYYRTLFAS